ncbi:MAG: hypothetical protein ACM3QU_07925 [Verrucomicrobiota bacterium]
MNTVRSSSGIKPKSQAYGHFDYSGVQIGPAKKIVAVAHVGTGIYCVQLANSLHVNNDTIALTIVDYNYSAANRFLYSQAYSNAAYCAGALPNSVAVLTNNASTGVAADASFFFIVP